MKNKAARTQSQLKLAQSALESNSQSATLDTPALVDLRGSQQETQKLFK